MSDILDAIKANNKRIEEAINSLEMNKAMQNAIFRMTILSAIQEAEKQLGIDHESTCARAISLLDFDQNSKEAAVVLRLYNTEYGASRYKAPKEIREPTDL